jgi:hypothetical protein
LCFALLLSTNAFSQSTNASVSGFVQDPSQAFIPGVGVTATNTQPASSAPRPQMSRGPTRF